MTKDQNNISNTWKNNVSKLEEYMQTKDMHNFLKWDVIKFTMFVGNSPYVAKELFFLLKNNWKKWKSAIKEVDFGKPTPFILYPYSSGNLIHNAYHLANFENITKQNIIDFDNIFEFGGGYGSMARLFSNLGYKGKYIIYDIPIFSKLQSEYLKNIGVKGVKHISNIEEIPVLDGSVLFIATWSLSEAPLQLRDQIIDKVKANSYLVAYQKSFDDVNNQDYFQKVMNEHKLKWYNLQIKHIPDNYYLIGI